MNGTTPEQIASNGNSFAMTFSMMCKIVIARPIGRGNLLRLLVIMIVTTPEQIASVVPPSQ